MPPRRGVRLGQPQSTSAVEMYKCNSTVCAKRELSSLMNKTRRSTSTSFRGKRGPERGPVRKMAEAAGLSRDWMYRALAIADIPETAFEELVESENPPTLTELNRIARNRHLKKPKATSAVHVCPHCGENIRKS